MKQSNPFYFFIFLLFINNLSFASTNSIDFKVSLKDMNPCPAPIISNFLPSTGPENTIVTITGSNFTDAATVTFDGIPTSFTVISDTEITAFAISALNTSATISISSTGGCVGNSAIDYNFIQPNCTVGDIYMSEIFDSESGSYGIIELFNPTSSSITLDGIYEIHRYGDVGDTGAPRNIFPLSGSIAPLTTYVIQLGSTGTTCSLSPDLTIGSGINDNDELKLVKNSVIIDIVEAPTERGYTIIRNPDATVPNDTFAAADWLIDGNESCSNLGSHTADPISSSIPLITQPAWQTICENGNASFTVSVATGTYTYQWKILDNSGNWVNVVNNTTYSGTNTNTLILNNVPASFNNNQYYCEITSSTCNLVSDATHLFVSNPEVDTLSNQVVCDSYSLPTLTNGTYYTGTNGTGTVLNSGQTISTTQTIYIYNESGTAPNICSNESSFTITITGTPPVDNLPNYTDCSSYILPVLSNGNYYTGSNGTGTFLNAGETISSSQTIYIYNEIGTAPNICSNESSFIVTISGLPPVSTIANQSACTNYSLPTITNGNYFTGSNGTGMMLNIGQVISTSQTIYIYNETGVAPNICFNESSFTVTIIGTPPVDAPSNHTGCSSYILPTLTNGDYYTGTGGTGTLLNAGETISNSQTIYIYNAIGTAPNICSNQSSFMVTILPTPSVDTLDNQDACTDYTLPNLTNGNYFTGSNGTGVMLNSGEIISTTQTIYIYNESGSAPNICTNESSFTVTIGGIPPVDTLSNQTDCSQYILPALTNGNYYTSSNGTGTFLNAGETISTSQTIYIYNEIGTAPNTCSNESSFMLTILGNPTIDVLPDEAICLEFSLPNLTNGNYFTGTNGTGTALFAGDVISTSQTIYIYAETGATPNICTNESSFNVTIFPTTDFDLAESNIQVNENTLTVTMSDTSINYEYAVDTGIFQSSPVFSGLSNGTHTLTVQDENGCVIKSIQFEITSGTSIIIPPFFTPNSDGQNDVWQITDTQNTIKEIFVYDRYGKLLKQVPLSSKSWDGLYRGNPKETNDYWYLINLHDGKQLNGHFTLKR